jgi:hypothetical protein
VALAQIVCRGLGPAATIALLVTVGYGSSIAPAVASEDLQGGWLAHTARWRGWQAPPRHARADDETEATTQARGQETVGQGPGFTGLVTPAPLSGALPALLATATVLPPLDWAPLLALAQADATRRQAQAARQEEEELLVLLMLVETL